MRERYACTVIVQIAEYSTKQLDRAAMRSIEEAATNLLIYQSFLSTVSTERPVPPFAMYTQASQCM